LYGSISVEDICRAGFEEDARVPRTLELGEVRGRAGVSKQPRMEYLDMRFKITFSGYKGTWRPVGENNATFPDLSHGIR